MTLNEAAAILERCPQCDGPMESVIIDGHESWACPKDASAYAKDQDWANDYELDDE